MISQKYLKSILCYDKKTGVFIWKDRDSWPKEVNSKYAGRPAGSYVRGYLRIGINGFQYQGHRLAWLYITGKNPKGQIDHKDMNPSNNAFDNLRDASMTEQRANCRKYVTNSSGYKGVAFHKKTKKWRAQIQVGGRQKYLGLFATPELAHAAYCNAAKKYHGEFARFA